MNTLIVQMFGIFAPIVADIIKRRQEADPNAPPMTDAELKAEFEQNIDRYLGEGSAWRATHPDV